MAAITWRTLNGGSPVEALGALNAAENSFSNAFGGVRDSLKQFQATEDANWQQTKLNNTNSYMDQLRSIDTPEKFAEAKASGLLDQLKQGYGAQVDSQRIGEAQDARMGILQDRAVKAGVYQDQQTDRTQRPVVDEIRMLYAKGDIAGGDALLAQHNELRNRAELVQAGVTSGREAKRFGWDGENHGFRAAEAGRAAEMGPLQLQQAREQILNAQDSRLTNAQQRAASAASIEASQAATKISKSTYESQQEQKLIDRAKLKMAGVLVGTSYADGEYNAKDIEGNFALMKMAGVAGGDLTKQRNVMAKLAEIQDAGGLEITTGTGKDKKTEKVPLSNAMVKAALAASADPFFTAGWNKGPANSVEDILQNMAKATVDVPQKDGTVAPVNKLLLDYQAYGAARRSAFPAPQASTPDNPVRALDNAIAASKKKQ